ncbi:hypothetical protein BC826DRAFT_158163 [Russula brevipes]|nr:hypothetical protein BC826DRAFT_158163 [Russula brevipes]
MVGAHEGYPYAHRLRGRCAQHRDMRRRRSVQQDSGGRTPLRRKRGATRRLRESAGGGGWSERLGSHERSVHCERASACGAGLERELWPAGVSLLTPQLASVLRVALSGAGLHGSSGRRNGKNRLGGTLVVFGERRDDIVTGAAESSASGSTLGPTLPLRPDEPRREGEVGKIEVRDRAGRRRVDGWRVSGRADSVAVGDGQAHPSGDMSRRRTQSSRRVAEWRI